MWLCVDWVLHGNICPSAFNSSYFFSKTILVICHQVQKLSLNVMTLLPKCENVETRQGVSLSVEAVAQVMVMCSDHMGDQRNFKENRDAFLQKALEQFLGKTSVEISNTIRFTLEGHLRAILGTLTVEEIYRDREHFAQMVCFWHFSLYMIDVDFCHSIYFLSEILTMIQGT